VLFGEVVVVVGLRLECLCLEVVDVGFRGRRCGCFGLGIDRGRKAERIELVLRSRSRECKSGLDAAMLLVWVSHRRVGRCGMWSKHCHVDLLAEKPRCVCERSAIDRLIERAEGYAEYVPDP
jgi:hypothetical protein